MTALQWRRGRSCAVTPDDSEVWLFGGAGPTRLSGGAAGALARGVDGTRSREELIEVAVSGGMPHDRATQIADRWIAAGHLQPAIRIDPEDGWMEAQHPRAGVRT